MAVSNRNNKYRSSSSTEQRPNSGAKTEESAAKATADNPANKRNEKWARRDEHCPPPYQHFTPQEKAHPPAGFKKAGIFLLFFGVILPAAAILWEARYHTCASICFDPMPTTSHIALCLLIPLSNLMYWLSTRRDLSDHYAFMSLASGMAMGVGVLYSLMFLPVVPAALVCIFVGGLGLLPLSPLLSLPFTWRAGKGICHLAEHRQTYFDSHQLKHFGHLIILIAVVAIELPSTLTRVHMARAAHGSVAAIKWLRSFGNEEVMLRACYEHSGRATDIVGSLYESTHPLSVDDARNTFFEVTGKPFNSVPIPKAAKATMLHVGSLPNEDLNEGVEDEFDLDPDIAGEMVSGIARGLTLKSSKITANIDANASVAAINWSFGFANSSTVDREARAKILLPAGAVIDSAKIRVNGKEKTATVFSRSLARAAYARAVHSKQDPLLVSTCGLDQVLVQCYPVTPGSDVSVELSMAAPVIGGPNAPGGTLALPAFAERNFMADEPNQVEISSNQAISVPSSVSLTSSDNSTKLTGKLDAAQLSRFAAVIAVHGPQGQAASATPDDSTMIGNGLDAPKHLIVLLDRSASMSPFMPDVIAGLKQLPGAFQTNMYTVDDDSANTVGLKAPLKLSNADHLQCEGGQDDSMQLNQALSSPSQKGSAILWIHAAQPVAKASAVVRLNLRQPGGPALYDLQVAAGPDEVLDGELVSQRVVRVPNTGNAEQSLKWLVSFWNNDDKLPTHMGLISDSAYHLIEKLGVNETVRRALWHAADSQPDVAKAINLASAMHLVTPVTSAVVVDPELLPETRVGAGDHSTAPNLGDDLTMLFRPMSTIMSGLGPLLMPEQEQSYNAQRVEFARKASVFRAQEQSRVSHGDMLYKDDPGSLSFAGNTANEEPVAPPSTTPTPRRFGSRPMLEASAGGNLSATRDLFASANAPMAKRLGDESEGDVVDSFQNSAGVGGSQTQGSDAKSLRLEGVPGQGFAGKRHGYLTLNPLEQLSASAGPSGNWGTLQAKPTPEPDTYALIGVAILMLGGALFIARRRRLKEVSGR